MKATLSRDPHRARPPRGLAAVLLGASATLLAPGAAAAFSDPLSYDDGVDLGGGAGRWFTGSPADGYGCDVCHEGGEPAPLSVAGLPLDGYQPGAAYEIHLGWPATVERLALIAEITDEHRVAAGTLEVPRPEATAPDERCGVEEGGFPASELHVTDEGRRSLVSTIDCGAARTRFRWTAPLTDVGTVWLSVGFVTSDESGDPSGDGVTMIKRAISLQREGRGSVELVEGCSSTGAGGKTPAPSATALMWVALALGWRGVRKERPCRKDGEA